MHEPEATDERGGVAVIARATVEEHWAVSAIAPDRRALLLERAELAMTAPGEGLGEPIADGLLLLGTAFELAAIAHLDDAVSSRDSSARELAGAVLQAGASRALRCAAALRPPADDSEGVTRWALRIAALAVVAREQDVFAEWWTRRRGVADQVQRFADGLDAEPWERYALGTIWVSWLGLLGAPVSLADARMREPRRRGSSGSAGSDDRDVPTTLYATRARLAAFRERRAGVVATRDDGVALNAHALRSRMSDFAVRHLADATELLTVAVIRRSLPDVSPTVRLHLAAARNALAGDQGLDLLLAWLQAAGLTLASGVTAQLDLPGL
ncbi:MAG: hypothetical protein RLZ55_510 [Actinomycetota bacterium]|jgi:hypothetical protein